MNINVDIGQMVQKQQEKKFIAKICAEHIECVDCPIKKDKEIKINLNKINLNDEKVFQVFSMGNTD